MNHIILVVDDDQLILNTMQKQFSGWDFQVYAADSPGAAKEALKKVTPEIILLDLLLTKDDGSQEILDFLESQERLQHVPVLVVTNMDKPELKQMLLERGVKEYIIKGSLTLEELRDKVMGYLEPEKSN